MRCIVDHASHLMTAFSHARTVSTHYTCEASQVDKRAASEEYSFREDLIAHPSMPNDVLKIVCETGGYVEFASGSEFLAYV